MPVRIYPASSAQVIFGQFLINQSASVFFNPVFVADAGNRCLADSLHMGSHQEETAIFRSLRKDDFLDIGIQTQINECLFGTDNLEMPFIRSVANFPYPVLTRNLHNNHQHIGWLMMWESRCQISRGQTDLFDHLGKIIEIWCLKYQSESVLKTKSMVFQRILDGGLLSDSLTQSYMKALGWNNEQEKYLLKIVSYSENTYNIQYLYNLMTRHFPEAYVFEFDRTITMIINKENWSDTQLQKNLCMHMKKLSLYAGKSYTFSKIIHIKESYHQAEIAIRHGDRKKGMVYSCEDHVQAYISEKIREHITPDISHTALDILQNYDLKHGTDYYNILHVYLLEERNQTKTAQRLNIHRNTLLKTLKRIVGLTDLDLDDQKVRFHLAISYLIQR